MPSRFLPLSLLGLAIGLALAGCRCSSSGPGEPCRVNADCDPGLICDPLEAVCVGDTPPADAGGSDAEAGAVSESGTGTDTGTDAGTDAAPPVCGNAVVESGEQCDPPSAACDALCQVTSVACPQGEGVLLCDVPVTSDTGLPPATDSNDTYSCTSSWGGLHDAPEVAYAFVSPDGAGVRFEMEGLTDNLELFLLTGTPECSTGTCVGASLAGGTAAERILLRPVAGQPYYLLVDGYGAATSPFTLRANCTPPPAGSGTCADPIVLEPGVPGAATYYARTCGEGNDGEPPTTLGDCTLGANGQDLVYRLDLASDTFVSLDLWDDDGPAPVDVVVYVRDACASAAPADNLYCSNDIALEPRHAHLNMLLPAGAYYVFVDTANYVAMGGTTFTCGDVRLLVDLLPCGACTPACGDGYLSPGEECDDGNFLAGDGCGPVCNLEDPCIRSVLPTPTSIGLLSAGTFDDGQWNLDIAPATFLADGTPMTRVAVSTNGYLLFGTTAFPGATGFAAADTDPDMRFSSGVPLIGWLSGDGDVDATTVTYALDLPNDRLVINFDDFGAYNESTSVTDVQVILHLTSGTFELLYPSGNFIPSPGGPGIASDWAIGISEPALAPGGTCASSDFETWTAPTAMSFPTGCVVNHVSGAFSAGPATASHYVPLAGNALCFVKVATGYDVRFEPLVP